MKLTRNLAALAAAFAVAVPAQACLKVSPHARSWVQCAYKVSHKTSDHKFMKNFADAKVSEDELLSTAQPRWDKLEKSIVKVCGRYSNAAKKDGPLGSRVSVNSSSGYVPKDQYWAIMDTSDRDKLVKK